MKLPKYAWIAGALVTLLIILLPIGYLAGFFAPQETDPWDGVPEHAAHTDHAGLFTTALTTGPEVTSACLECHEGAATEVMATSHWTWSHGPYDLPGYDEPVYTGKANVLNNFCIGIQSNEPACTACHAGYGWVDGNFDFTDPEAVDCLACHDQSGQYIKSKGGLPAEGVDLVAAAESVANPTRDNCGSCHFSGGGGDAVKHGDLDNSLFHPSPTLDVHMGEHNFLCTDCHKTEEHQVAGRAISVSLDDENQIYCTDCHDATPHDDDRINAHTSTVACQTCHIPEFARKEATKVEWLWSEAGQDIPENVHEYLKIKGAFVYESNVVPTYAWYSGTADRYILGDIIDPTQTTSMTKPKGSITDPQAKIFPFKVHMADQPYDAVNNYLLQVKTFGEDGYWTDFDWDQAARLGSEAVGLDYSGEYGFANTSMYWPITHMVAPATDSLQCDACHVENGGEGRLDWKALGYDGDPMYFGSRELGARPGSVSSNLTNDQEAQQ
jgi:octaheme c-type cytochrome (tetrathionate reductase family)